MRKINLLWIMFIVLSVGVMAVEEYLPRENIPLGVHLSNSSGDVVGANCSAQIRDGSFNVLANIALKEINGGWYNATYNTSSIGYFYCLQNCTLGTSYTADTCDFTVKGGKEMFVAIAIILIGITITLFAISMGVDQKEHPALKTFFLIMSIIMAIVSFSFGYQVSVDNGMSEAIQRTLLAAYKISIYATVVFVGYILIYLIYQILTKSKQGDG